MKRSIVYIIAILLLTACTSEQASYWSRTDAWYVAQSEPDTTQVDVFYIASTDIVSSKDSEAASAFKAPWPDGCLHHFDLMFYPEIIWENAINRAYK